MPLRQRAPYLPHIYVPPRGGGGRGIDVGGAIGSVGKLIKAFQAQGEQARANQIANQLMNTATPPRAALVSPGVNPASGAANVVPAGVPTAGTSPITGGLQEMQIRQQFSRSALADKLQQARIATELMRGKTIGARGGGGRTVTGGGSASAWLQQPGGGQQPGGRPGGKAAKAGQYQAGTGDVENDPTTDNFDQIRADFDSQHGKGSFDQFTKNFSNIKPDGKGNLVLTDNDGNPVMDKSGLPAYSIPASDGSYWTQRYNAARIRQNQGYLGDLPQGTNPNSGQPSGTKLNPIPVQNNLGLRSLPYNTYMQMPDGSVRPKLPLQPQAGGGGEQAPSAETPSTEASSAEAPSEEEQNPDDMTGEETAGAQDLYKPSDVLS